MLQALEGNQQSNKEFQIHYEPILSICTLFLNDPPIQTFTSQFLCDQYLNMLKEFQHAFFEKQVAHMNSHA